MLIYCEYRCRDGGDEDRQGYGKKSENNAEDGVSTQGVIPVDEK